MASDDDYMKRIERWLLSVEYLWSSDSPVARIKAFPVKLAIEGGVGFVTATVLTVMVYGFDQVFRIRTQLHFLPEIDQVPTVIFAAGVFITGLAFCNLIKEVES